MSLRGPDSSRRRSVYRESKLVRKATGYEKGRPSTGNRLRPLGEPTFPGPLDRNPRPNGSPRPSQKETARLFGPGRPVSQGTPRIARIRFEAPGLRANARRQVHLAELARANRRAA